MQIEMTQVKKTKGTVVFGNDAPDTPIRTLYIAKGKKIDGVSVEELQTITVTLAKP